jgi:hypothetical protein
LVFVFWEESALGGRWREAAGQGSTIKDDGDNGGIGRVTETSKEKEIQNPAINIRWKWKVGRRRHGREGACRLPCELGNGAAISPSSQAAAAE